MEYPRCGEEEHDGDELDAEQREFQFGIVCVLGGQDHAALLRQTKLHNMTNQYTKAFRAAGVPNASLKASLYNDNGKLIAFEVDLGNATKYGTGRHLLLGGGGGARCRRRTRHGSAICKCNAA